MALHPNKIAKVRRAKRCCGDSRGASSVIGINLQRTSSYGLHKLCMAASMYSSHYTCQRSRPNTRAWWGRHTPCMLSPDAGLWPLGFPAIHKELDEPWRPLSPMPARVAPWGLWGSDAARGRLAGARAGPHIEARSSIARKARPGPVAQRHPLNI